VSPKTRAKGAFLWNAADATRVSLGWTAVQDDFLHRFDPHQKLELRATCRNWPGRRWETPLPWCRSVTCTTSIGVSWSSRFDPKKRYLCVTASLPGAGFRH